MNIVDEDNRSRPQGRVVKLVEEDQHHMSMAPQYHNVTRHGATVPQHECNNIVPQERHLRGITHMVYRHRPGSGPAEQGEKVNLAWKSSSTTTSGRRGFLQPADTTPNVGAKSGGREEWRGMNEPRGQGGLYIGGGAR
jgi:hypothetical protein